MSDSNVIRQFLVSLGWDVDQQGMNRFSSSIAVQSEAVHALGETLEAAARKVIDFTRGIAEGLDNVYFASVKTKASASNLNALQYAAEQTGISFEGLKSNLQNIANLIRYRPGYEGWMHQLGVDTRDANGQLRDTSEIFRDLAKQIGSRPNAAAYIDKLGIDPQVLEAINSGKFDQFFKEHKEMANRLGVNEDSAAQQGNAFETAQRRLQDRLKIFEHGVGGQLLARLEPQFEHFIDLLTTGLEKLIYWWDHLTKQDKQIIQWALAIGAALAALVIGLTALGTILSVAGVALGGLAGALAFLLNPFTLVAGAAVALGIVFRKEIPWQAMIDGAVRLKDSIADLITSLADKLPAGLKKAGSQASAFIKDLTGADGKTDHLRKESGGGFEYDDSNYQEVKGWLGLGADKQQTPNAAADTRDPRGIRNNNPGNIEAGSFTAAHGATGVEAAGRFATFATPQAGLNALADLLGSYASKGLDTTRSILEKYAPNGENDTEAYISSVSKRLGVTADTHLNFSDPAMIAQLEAAIVKFENGRNPYSAEMYAQAAQRVADRAKDLSGQSVAITQNITTNVNGGSDPRAVGDAVTTSINKSNGLMLRALQARTS